MRTVRFEDLVKEAKEQLESGEIKTYNGLRPVSVYCDRTARGLQEKIDEITETYLEDVPESFDDLEILECYIQDLREVIDELKLDIDTFRSWGRRYGLTAYAKAILWDADDVVKDLIFERSAAERAYDIIYEFFKNEEKAELEREQELEAARINDEDELILAMCNLVKNYGYDRLQVLVGIVADYTGNVRMDEGRTSTHEEDTTTRTEPYYCTESTDEEDTTTRTEPYYRTSTDEEDTTTRTEAYYCTECNQWPHRRM